MNQAEPTLTEPKQRTAEDGGKRFVSQIREFVARNYDGDPADITEETTLIDAGIMDSFAAGAFIAFARQQLGIAVPPQRLTVADLETVGSLAALLDELHPDG